MLKFMFVIKFSVGCQHKEEIVATKKLMSLQMKQKEGRNYVVTRYLLLRQEFKKQYRKNIATDKFMLQHNEEQKAKSMWRKNPLLSRH